MKMFISKKTNAIRILKKINYKNTYACKTCGKYEAKEPKCFNCRLIAQKV